MLFVVRLVFTCLLLYWGDVSWQWKSLAFLETASLGTSLSYFQGRCRTSDSIRLGWWTIWWWIKRTSEYWPSVRWDLPTAWKLVYRYFRESAIWQSPFIRSFTGILVCKIVMNLVFKDLAIHLDACMYIQTISLLVDALFIFLLVDLVSVKTYIVKWSAKLSSWKTKDLWKEHLWIRSNLATSCFPNKGYILFSSSFTGLFNCLACKCEHQQQ